MEREMRKIEIEYLDGFEDAPMEAKISLKAYKVFKVENGERNGNGRGYALKKLFNRLYSEGLIFIRNGSLSLERLQRSKRVTYVPTLESDLIGYKGLVDERKRQCQQNRNKI